MGTLYIVATPIGNLQDITKRAVDILRNVNFIACEDTRMTSRLLREIGVEKKQMLISYYEQTEDIRIPNIVNLLLNNQDVALVSDSGTPLVSDPGFPLVRECISNGIKTISVPGPSASISALVSSGLPTDKFIFAGFLPKKEGNRINLLKKLKKVNEELEATVIIFEAPHRLIRSLHSIKDVFGDIEITLARELTKIHEETIKDKITNLVEKYNKQKPKGEFVVLFNTKKLRTSQALN